MQECNATSRERRNTRAGRTAEVPLDNDNVLVLWTASTERFELGPAGSSSSWAAREYRYQTQNLYKTKTNQRGEGGRQHQHVLGVVALIRGDEIRLVHGRPGAHRLHVGSKLLLQRGLKHTRTAQLLGRLRRAMREAEGFAAAFD